MFSRQQLRVFTLMTIFFALAQANWFNSNPFRREVVEKKDLTGSVNSALNGVAGGLLGTGAATTTSGTSASATDKSTSTIISSSTPTPTPTTSTSVPPKTSNTPTPTESSSTTDAPTPTPTPTNTDNSQSATTTTQVVPGSQTSGDSSTGTSSSAKSSSSASAQQNQASSSSMSPKTKTTVIGVVVGVGGVIVLAGLFVVAWRIWGRKKNEDDSDGLMGFRSGSAGHEKSNSVSGNGPQNPFQSTLENYHNPARNVNASSNF